MTRHKLTKAIFVLLLISMSTALVPFSVAQNEAVPPPPTPPYIMTAPKINEITYVIEVKNINASWVTIDLALPKTWIPDTYVKIKEIKIAGATTVMNYTDRENPRVRTYTRDFKPDETVAINVTFYSLKYRLDYATHQPITTLSFPNEYAMYTQPENYIESNDPLITNRALALVGNRTNPFRIAERMYDFARNYVTYKVQTDIRGAIWAIQNGIGDCTEFGTLFVALMRAVGIPARTVVGQAARELSTGGVANASRGWVDSPHLWAEFYVDGYGWVPVDPTFGKKDPTDHFGIAWAYYLPFMKGPTMNDVYPSLVNIRYEASTKINYVSYLIVNPLNSLPFEDKALQDFMAANNQTNIARRVANKAYDYSFNVTGTYPLLESAYALLGNATKTIGEGNSTQSSQYSLSASADANQALDMISSITINEAQLSVNRAWNDLRVLGALGGENYLRMARTSQNNHDYVDVVQNSYFARTTADQAPSVFLFLGPVVFCVFTIGLIGRKNHKAKSSEPTAATAS